MLKSSRIDEIGHGPRYSSRRRHSEAAEKALPFLSHDSILVKRSAARCIARFADKKTEPPCAPSDRRAGSSARQCLPPPPHRRPWKYRRLDYRERHSSGQRPFPAERTDAGPKRIIVQMGLKIVPLLLRRYERHRAARTGADLGRKNLWASCYAQLQANLIDILDIEIERAYFYFYFGHTIQAQYPLYDLEMLQDALLSGYQSVIDCIIHLLGAAGSIEDPELLVRGAPQPQRKNPFACNRELGKNLRSPDLPSDRAACRRYASRRKNGSLPPLAR